MMKHAKKLVAAIAISAPVVVGDPAAAVTVDDPIYDVVGNTTVRVEEITGHADGRPKSRSF